MKLTVMQEHRVTLALGYPRNNRVDVHVDRALGRDELVGIFRAGIATLLVDDGSSTQPTVIEPDRRFDVWERVIEPRLVEPDAGPIRLEDFPGEYCFTALLCRTVPADGPTVLFRVHH